MSIAGIPVGWLVCSVNRSAPDRWCLGWLHHDPSKGLVALCQAQKGCNERQTCSGQWNMVRPLVAEFTPEKQNSWALLNVSLPLICHFEYQQTLGLELALYEVVEGSKTEKVQMLNFSQGSSYSLSVLTCNEPNKAVCVVSGIGSIQKDLIYSFS